ncbi:L-serine dehydratase/L-threonine deaminase-like [Lampetra fluviatilis]
MYGVATSPLHQPTPLRESPRLSAAAGADVLLKLENAQPGGGSFKIRGVGLLCQRASALWHGGGGRGVGGLHFVCSSGGNAGMAAAYAARRLGGRSTVFVPRSTASSTRERLQEEGASVQVVGDAWDETNEHALRVSTEEGDGCCYVHSFDDPLLWEGHASLVHELKATMAAGSKPGAVVVSVGGGGLLCGVVRGLREVGGWGDVPVIAVETQGAHSLHAALSAGELVTLPAITSVAKTLGAKRVAEQAFTLAREHAVFSEVVSDRDAIDAVQRFLDDERMLVEPACGAALAAVYSGVVRRLVAEGRLGPRPGPIVVVVCGGSGVTLGQLREWREQLGMGPE